MIEINIIKTIKLNDIDKKLIIDSSNTWCKNLIDEEFIENNIIKSTNYVLCAYYNDKLCGYLIYEIEKNILVYIHLICTVNNKNIRVGTALFDYLEKIAVNNNINMLELNAFSESVDFYLKKGFKIRSNKYGFINMYKKLK